MFIIYAIILYEDQIARISFIMAPASVYEICSRSGYPDFSSKLMWGDCKVYGEGHHVDCFENMTLMQKGRKGEGVNVNTTFSKVKRENMRGEV